MIHGQDTSAFDKEQHPRAQAKAVVGNARSRLMSILMCGLVIGLAILLSGCTDKDDLVAFDGQYFKAKLSKIDKQRDQFSIAVTPASASLEGAREAGRYEATKYCIAQYGTSDVDWVVGPESEADALRIEGDTLTFQGACNA